MSLPRSPDALAILESHVLHRRMRGERPSDIALALAVPLGDVLACTARIAQQVREETVDMAAELYAIANMRLEELWRACQRGIDDMVSAGAFDANVVRAAISVLERQAKMNGLDRTRGSPRANDPGDWLESATPRELAARAKALGLSIPDTLTLPEHA